MKIALIIILNLTSLGALASAFENLDILKEETDPIRYMILFDQVTTSEIDDKAFTKIITEVYSVYVNEGVSQERFLNLYMDWKTPYFSAWATELSDTQFQINFWGGFARLPGMLHEIFEFVVCHELGHILGAEPRHRNKLNPWASAEGQSDHFAVTECLPKYYKRFNKLIDFDSTLSMPLEVSMCLDQYIEKDAQNLCLKILRAGRGFAAILMHLYPDKDLPTYEKSAPEVPETLYNSYPSLQCRIDIFKNASKCLESSFKRNPCWYK